jgi:transposase
VVTARAVGIPVVCVQPLLVHRAREGEDFTRNRSDLDDAVIIGRLTAELRCYQPYLPEGRWARLRHLGARRAELLTRATAARQALRDLLECAWPALLYTAAGPLDSLTWRAALAVSADPAAIAAMSLAQFTAAVRAQVQRVGKQRVCGRIVRAIHAAAGAPGGIAAERDAALERAGFAHHDWTTALGALIEVETRMVAVLDQLHLTQLVATIPGLSAVGAAAILAETGDPARYDTPRTWVKHAGLAPRANESGTFRGQTRISGRGRPGLRTAAWRAIWAALRHNPVWHARHAYLTGRATNRLVDGRARAAAAAALLRQLFVVITRRVSWDPAIAAGTTYPREVSATAA